MLRQNVGEVSFLPFGAIQAPKTILDIPFGHKDFGLILHISHCVNCTCKGVIDLVDGSCWGRFERCFINLGNSAPILKPKGEGEVQDGLVPARFMWDHRDWGDLELCRWVVLYVLPIHHARLSGCYSSCCSCLMAS